LNRQGEKVAKGREGFLVARCGEISSSENDQQCQENGNGARQGACFAIKSSPDRKGGNWRDRQENRSETFRCSDKSFTLILFVIMKMILRFLALSFVFLLSGCGLTETNFHDTTAQEHDWQSAIWHRMRREPVMVAIQRRHEKIFGEPPNSPRPFIYRIGDKVVYCDVSREVKNRRGETIHSTPNITNHEIEGIWRIFQRVVRDSGYSGKVVFDVWIDGRRYRLVEERPGSRIKSSRFRPILFRAY
jgi:hypothetical protein